MRRESAPRNILVGPNSTKAFNRVPFSGFGAPPEASGGARCRHGDGLLVSAAGFERAAPARDDAPKQPSAAPACRWSEPRTAKRLPRVNDGERYGGPS